MEYLWIELWAPVVGVQAVYFLLDIIELRVAQRAHTG